MTIVTQNSLTPIELRLSYLMDNWLLLEVSLNTLIEGFDPGSE